MESPALSDPTFKAFLEKLQKQNNQQLATNLLQLKAEREIAGEDDDKREEQLEQIGSKLETISTTVSGYNIEPLTANGENQLEILKKALEELSLIRKISEGSLEYDKASAQYRNTSGRELVSKVSGKEIKKGAYVDFESAADRLIGQGKRVREQNVLNLKPSVAVQPRTLPSRDKPDQEDDKSKFQGFFKELTEGVKFYLTDGLSEKPGYGLFQTPSKEVEKKEREQKISSDRQKVESPTNPESDNITTSQEIVADASKQDLELSKQLLETTKEQLKTLQEIKEALAPKTPAELPSKGPVVEPKEEKEEEKGGSSLVSDAMDLLGKGKGIAGKAGRGAASLGGKLARFAGSTGGKALGAAAAVGLGAYTAYQGYTGAEEEKQNELQAIDAKVKAGEITPEQGEQLKKETAAKTTENKGGAIGEGTGMAAGAIGGGIAGAKVGATIGTFIGGPVGTAIGAGIGTIAGGAIGAISGSSVGKNIGGAIGKGVAGIKSFFGMEDTSQPEQEKGKIETSEITLNEKVFAEKDPESYKKFAEFREQRTKQIIEEQTQKLGLKQPTAGIQNLSSSIAKKEAIQKFQKEIDAAGAGKLITKTEGKPSVEPKQEGLIDQAKSLGSKVAGFFGMSKSEQAVTPAPTTKGPVPTGSLDTSKPAVSPTLSKGASTGLEVARTSTENNDMAREVANQPSTAAPIISNNVQSSNTTKYVPSKPVPRPEYSGSALDRYTNRIAVF